MKEDTKSAVALALEGVHQGAHIRSANFLLGRDGRARAEKQNVLRKKTAADVLPLALLSGIFFFVFRGHVTQVGVCVLHIKPFFLPWLCRRDFFLCFVGM